MFPNWSPDLQLTTGYIRTGVLVLEFELIAKLIDATQIKSIQHLLTELYLRKGFTTSDIAHVSFVLVSETIQSKNFELQNFSNNYFSDHSNKFAVTSHKKINRLAWDTKHKPLVSLIIPTKDAADLVKMCVDSIRAKTTYVNYEIILVDNNSEETSAIEYFQQLASDGIVKLIKYPHAFNYSAINNFAVKHCDGEVIGLINNDIEVIEPQWLDYMVGHVLREDIGCVGAKLLYPNDTIQHAGVAMGYGGGAGHAHKYFRKTEFGYLSRLAATNEFSAVTAACLLVTREDYDAVGGLNEQDLTVAFNDVDFCLKVLELGRRNLYCAEAVLYHHESVSRGLDIEPEKKARFEKELDYLQTNWAHYIENDPCYNPNLTLTAENFSLRNHR